ncbi:DUF397 domain-containing protein [Streptomyces abikoensis]
MNDPRRPDLAQAIWRKSSYSGNGLDCVEVADGYLGVTPVRDSKQPEGPALVLSATSWSAFVGSIKDTSLD